MQLERKKIEELEQLKKAERGIGSALKDLGNIRSDIGDNINNIFTNLSFKPF
jgi:hypothetical protein